MNIQTPPAWVAAAWALMVFLASLPWGMTALVALSAFCTVLNFLLMGMPGMFLGYAAIPLLRLLYGPRALERLGGQNYVSLGMGVGFLWPVMIFPLQAAVGKTLPGVTGLARLLACGMGLAAWCLLLPALLYPFWPKAKR